MDLQDLLPLVIRARENMHNPLLYILSVFLDANEVVDAAAAEVGPVSATEDGTPPPPRRRRDELLGILLTLLI